MSQAGRRPSANCLPQAGDGSTSLCCLEQLAISVAIRLGGLIISMAQMSTLRPSPETFQLYVACSRPQS